MRLSDEQRSIIRGIVAEVAGGDARVSLFGSRTRDDLRGGDIDLLVELPHAVPSHVVLAVRLEARIGMALGDRKVDVVVVDPSTRIEPIHEAAMRDGQPL